MAGGSPHWYARPGLAAAVVFAITAAVYLPSLSNDLIYDDHELILRQEPPRHVADVLRVFTERHWKDLPYYRPVARTTMVVQKLLHGDRPTPYHLFNILVTGLVAVAALALLRSPPLGVAPGPALIAATLFAVHPVTSSCSYPVCSGRESLLPALFSLLALSAFLRGGAVLRGLTVVLTALALLSKEQAVVLVALLFAVDVLGLAPEPPGRSLRRWLLRHGPMLGVLAAYFATRAAIFASHEAPSVQLAVLDHPGGPVLSVLHALQTSVLPGVRLAYEPRPEIWLSAPRLALALGLAVAIAASSWRARRRVGRIALFWAAVFLAFLLPTANIFVQEARFDERYVLLSLLALVGLGATLVSTLPPRSRLRRGILVAATVALLPLAAISVGRARAFSSDMEFFEAWIRSDAEAYSAHLNRGVLLNRAGRLDEAEQDFLIALRGLPGVAKVHAGLADVAGQRGDIAAARAHLEQALRVQPDDVPAHVKMGTALAMQGDFERAIHHVREALRLDPRNSLARASLEILLARQQATGSTGPQPDDRRQPPP